MDLTEVLQRIVRGHWFVLTACIVLGVAGGIAIGRTGHPTYTASTRLALGTTSPQTEAEAAAISSVAEAIATSTTQVRDALDVANVKRDASKLASNDVTVRSLGTSNIVEVAVRDRDRRVAQRIANALGTQLEQTWLAIGHGQAPDVVRSLNARLDDLSQKIAALDAQINSVVDPGRGTDPVRTLLARREDLARQAVALETERDRVVSQDALDVRATIIERATLPDRPDSNGFAQEIFLGGLAGLLLGLGLAALREALRPTLVGSRRIASTTGSALLGRLERLPSLEDRDVGGSSDVATRIFLAASAAKVDVVELVAAPAADLEPLAAALREHSASAGGATNGKEQPGSAAGDDGHGSNGAGDRERHGGSPTIRVFDRAHPQRRRSAGLVIVSPTRTTASAFEEVEDLATITGWRVLGVVTYEPARFFHRAAGRIEARTSADAAAASANFRKESEAVSAGGADHDRGGAQ